MNDMATPDAYGVLTEPTTLTIQRLLPGPIERIWGYLTQSDLRRQWLASGDMDLCVDAPFELVWHNDELTQPPGTRPEGFSAEHHMQSRIVEVDPPHKLVFSWGERGEVTFELQPKGERVLLTVIHRGVPDRSVLLRVSAGWHMHLDVLASITTGQTPGPFWDGWIRLQADYDHRMPV